MYQHKKRDCRPASCCEVEKNVFKCCPYTNGVCCRDGKICCPQGTKCNLELGQCQSPNGVVFPPKQLSQKVNNNLNTSVSDTVLKRLSVNYVLCPNRQSVCHDNNTCCPMSGELWGCCLGANAVCCPDGKHCCPHGSVCDTVHQGCKSVEFVEMPETKESLQSLQLVSASAPARLNPNAKLSEKDWRKKIPQLSAKHLMAYTGVVCPDPLYECPADTTCCYTSEEGWACCPMPQAVCCNDGEHCCPNGYRCDLSVGNCVRFSTDSSDDSQKPSSNIITLSSSSRNISCPNSNVYCPDNTTCCKYKDQWGCCLFPNAVCCSDGIHCCPENTICNLQQEICVSTTSGEFIDKLQLKSQSQIQKHDGKVSSNTMFNICPDKRSICMGSSTCCSTNVSSVYFCCPHENAVCCGDGKHCCPQGATCDPIKGGCIPKEKDDDSSKSDHIPLLKKFAALRVTSKENSLSTSFTEICPGGKAKCPDKTTCCELKDGQYGCCPGENAVCCGDGKHCCPQGSTCDLIEGGCVPGEVEICPGDKSKCPAKTTCCELKGGEYGCCPGENATCCTDGIHCCPSETTCDYKTKSCIKKIDNDYSADDFLHNPTLLFNRVRDHTCPDHQSVCTDEQTCCQLPDDRSWGCCPLPNAVCCADRLHCCPDGTTCDLEANTCIESFKFNQSTTKIISDGFNMLNAVQKSSTSGNSQSQPMKSLNTIATTTTTTTVVQAKWCGACGDTWACCPNTNFNEWLCCPYVGGECCIGHNTCCPRGSHCLPDGKCEQLTKNILKSFAPNLIPSTPMTNNNLPRSSFIQQTNEKEEKEGGRFRTAMSKAAKPAQRNILLRVSYYRRLKRNLHTICPDSLHYCDKSEQCCLSNKFGYTCTSNKSTCCAANTDTYCPALKDCSSDGKYCIDPHD
ncbi:unnamed protein product [Schistosoma turkestanicum]|nr:unnamed protein product [Schistosoma turkestanicum]